MRGRPIEYRSETEKARQVCILYVMVGSLECCVPVETTACFFFAGVIIRIIVIRLRGMRIFTIGFINSRIFALMLFRKNVIVFFLDVIRKLAFNITTSPPVYKVYYRQLDATIFLPFSKQLLKNIYTLFFLLRHFRVIKMSRYAFQFYRYIQLLQSEYIRFKLPSDFFEFNISSWDKRVSSLECI